MSPGASQTSWKNRAISLLMAAMALLWLGWLLFAIGGDFR